jgi:hypothetical protein
VGEIHGPFSVATLCRYLASRTPGREGVPPEEPAAGNLHGGVCEEGELSGAIVDLKPHEAGNGGAKESLKPSAFSSTRKGKGLLARPRGSECIACEVEWYLNGVGTS